MSSVLNRAMNESQLMEAVIEAARHYGWMVAHFRPALTARGWRTPVQGDPGFPDLCLAKNGRVLFLELKSEKGKVSPFQEAWLDAFDSPERLVYAAVIRPDRLDFVLEILRS